MFGTWVLNREHFSDDGMVVPVGRGKSDCTFCLSSSPSPTATCGKLFFWSDVKFYTSKVGICNMKGGCIESNPQGVLKCRTDEYIVDGDGRCAKLFFFESFL